MQEAYSEQDWLSFWPLNRGGGLAEISFIWGKWRKKKSEQIQLEIRHAIDDLVEDISEKMQEGMDREYNPRSSAGALNSGKDYIRKELETIILYPDELERGRDVFRSLHASCLNSR